MKKEPEARILDGITQSSPLTGGSQHMTTMAVDTTNWDGIDDVTVVVKGYDSMPGSLCREIADKMGWKVGK